MNGNLALQILTLERRIAEGEAAAAKLRNEIVELETEMEDFQARYDKMIRPMSMRLEVVKGAIEDILRERRKKTYHVNTALPEHYESVEDQFNRIWTKTKPEVTDFRGNVVQVPNKRREYIPKKKPDDPMALLKVLYRDLARRFHPDLGATDMERANRTEIMTHINAAYADDDWEALQAISDEIGDIDAASLKMPSEDVITILKISGLQKQFEALETQIVILENQKDELYYGEMMKLKLDEKLAKMKGRDLLAEIRDQMQREYDELLVRLDQLRAGLP
jgi:hypothetical protein